MPSLVKLIPLVALAIAVYVARVPHVVLRVPKVGFILYSILGGPVPGYITPETYKLEKLWVEPHKTVIFSVAAKSGTTWNLNMAHQLRTKGDADFDDILLEVPWIEFLYYPGMPLEEKVKYDHALAAKHGDAQYYKAHFGPPQVTIRDDVRYVVVVRNPLDGVNSMRQFFANHDPEFVKLWGGFPDRSALDTDDQFQHWVTTDIGDGSISALEHFFISFYVGWYPYRHRKNVLFTHYEDIKRDHRGYLRKLAKFLDLNDLSEADFDRVEELTSFKWMKENAVKFNAPTLLKDFTQHVPAGMQLLRPNALIAEGKSGMGSVKLTKELREEIARLVKEGIPDDAMRNWFLNGGPVPK